MDVPLEIGFHNMDASEFAEARIRERVAKLEKLYDRLISCRVVIEAPHRQHQKGNLYRVRIDMSVPGDEIVVSREPHRAKERYADPDVYTVIRDAFDVAERRLKEFKQRQRFETKIHDTPMHGRIVRIESGQNFGFLLNAEGNELWFHRNAVMNEDLENLHPDDPVHYVETIGETGPQASRVWRVESTHRTEETERAE